MSAAAPAANPQDGGGPAAPPVAPAAGAGKPAPRTPGSGGEPDRDAAIFLPNLAGQWTDQSIETMARRVAVALDRSASAEARFVAKLGSTNEVYGNGLKASVATISRVDGAAELPLIDVYGFEYHASLTSDWTRRNLFTKALLVFVMTLYSTVRLIGSITRPRSRERRPTDEAGDRERTDGGGATRNHVRATSPLHVLQLLYGLGILLVFSVYAAVVVVAFLQTAAHLPWLSKGHPSTLAQRVVVIATAVGLSVPKVRDWISKLAVDYLSAITYLGFGQRKTVIAGELQALLEHLAEHRDPTYARIHLIGYSFGSVIALDTLFPKGTAAPLRADKVRTVVTIGCPFDMVRTYWRDYFTERDEPGGRRKWWNVFNPDDVLSSNFRNDAETNGAPTEGLDLAGDRAPDPGGDHVVRPDENIVYNPSGKGGLTIKGLFALTGLRAHAAYWDDDVDADTCLIPVMSRIYAGTKALR